MQTIHLNTTISEYNPNQILFQCPKTVGSGNFFLETFSSDLKLMVMDMNFYQPVILIKENNPYIIGMNFIGKGKSEDFCQDYKYCLPIAPKTSGYFTHTQPITISKKIFQKNYQQISIIMELNTLTKLADEDEQTFAPFVTGLKHKPFHVEENKLTPIMSNILQQIFNCPYRGKTRSLFLESKMLELMVCKLEQIKTSPKNSCRPTSLKQKDKERVHFAAKLLEQQIENPPDLSELAKAAGLSRSKFHACFSLEFGCSPLEYLRDIRLSQAKKLLEQGSYNVTEAAYKVGYNNLGHFSRLFQKRYLALPHELARNSRQIR